MIAASIMMGRALAPIEIAIGNWRGFVAARDSIRRLSATLARMPAERGVTDLPKPAGSLSVENVTVAAPNGNHRDPDQRPFPPCGGRRARRDRTERLRQELAVARHPRNLAAGARIGPPRQRRARSMGSRRARPAPRLHVADGRAVPRHRRREHRAHGAGARQRRRAARRAGGRRPRHDPAAAGRLRHA